MILVLFNIFRRKGIEKDPINSHNVNLILVDNVNIVSRNLLKKYSGQKIIFGKKTDSLWEPENQEEMKHLNLIKNKFY